MTAEQPYTETGMTLAPRATCGHSYRTHLRGGARISVRICPLCGSIDYDDLDEQVATIEREQLERLQAAGRLLPEGASARGMCGEAAPLFMASVAELRVCELLAGHSGWHGSPNAPGQPWMNWTEHMVVESEHLTTVCREGACEGGYVTCAVEPDEPPCTHSCHTPVHINQEGAE